MKSIFSQLLILTATLNLNAQNLQWAKGFGSTGLDVGYQVSVDSSGDIYTLGRFLGTVDFDPGPGVNNISSNGSSDVFLLKQNASGTIVWVKTFGGTGGDQATEMELDSSGFIYLLGTFQDTVDFDPGPGVLNVTCNGGEDIFLVKLTFNGDFVWAKTWGGTGFDTGRSIIQGTSQYLYVTGIFDLTVDMDPGPGVTNLTSQGNVDVFTTKFDSAGNFIWVKQVGGTYVEFSIGLERDAQENIYTTGGIRFTTDFDPGPGIFNLTTVGMNDIFVSKSDSAGNFIFAKTISGSADEYCRDFISDEAGNMYLTGVISQTTDFEPGSGTYNLSSNGSFDVFICKLDSSGNLCWAKKFGSAGYDDSDAIVFGNSNELYVTGVFSDTVDFDPGAGVSTLISYGLGDIFVSKFDTSGNFLWVKQFGGKSADGGTDIAEDILGNIYVTGFFSDTCDFDPGSGIFNLTSNSVWDAFIVKLGSGTSGVTENFVEKQMNLFPNPASGSVTLMFNKPQTKSSLIIVYDILGKTIMNAEIPAGLSSKELDLSGFPKGIYLVKVLGINEDSWKVVIE